MPNPRDRWNIPIPKPKCTRRLTFDTNDTTVDFHLKEGESNWLLASPNQMLLWLVKIEKIGEE